MTEKQEQDRIDALHAMREFSIKVLWGKVVERGRGLNFKVHGVHTRMQGVMETVRELHFPTAETPSDGETLPLPL